MSKKSAKNAALSRLLKTVKRVLANNVFYANNVAPDLAGNTTLLNGKRNSFKSISLVNRLLNNLRINTVKLQKPLKSTLTNIRQFGLTAWLQDPL
jgi:hypothetical protein